MFKQIAAIDDSVRLLDGEFLLNIPDSHIESAPFSLGCFERIDGDTGASGAEMREMLPVGTTDIEHRFLAEPEYRYDMSERF